MPTLPRSFYLRDTREVARDLLGKELVRVSPAGTTSGIIVETEAYSGLIDPACHAYGERRSARTEIMFHEGGRAYVYLIYGMYHCLNLTTGPEGTPDCVLIRALEPREGIDLMRLRRNLAHPSPRLLTNGPGKLCQSMAIDRTLYGADLCGDILFVQEGGDFSTEEIGTSPRINIEYAGHARDFDWRFFIRGNPFVSRSPIAL